MNRLKELRKQFNMTQDDLARVLNVNRSAVSKYETGFIPLTADTIAILTDHFKCSADYLLGNSNHPQPLPPNAIPVEGFARFPIIGSIKAGYDGAAVEEFTEEFEYIPLSELNGNKQEDFFMLRVKGVSMYPRYLEGDTVLVKRCTSVDSGSIAVVLYNDTEATLKRVKYVCGEDWMELIPINPEYPVKRVEGRNLELCRILGKVVKLIRDER